MREDKNVLIYGDVFVDHIADDPTNTAFTAHVGGTTVNVAAGIARLGGKASYITVTGEDATSDEVRRVLRAEGIDLTYAKQVPEKRVNGVMVHLQAGNERVFHSYIDETPHIQVKPGDLEEKAFQQAAVFHLASGTMFHPVALETTRLAVRYAKRYDVLLSFDANIRLARWPEEENCRETILSFLPDIDLLKVTKEELFFLMQTRGMEEALAKLAAYQIPAVFVTMGEAGTLAVIGTESHQISALPVKAIDTTGAGDAFMAALLQQVQEKGKPVSAEGWYRYTHVANRAGALAVTRQGALSAMPAREELLSMEKCEAREDSGY